MRGQRGGEERLRVGMPRLRGDDARGTGLDDAPEVHHGDHVAHVRDGGQVVSDEEVGQAELALQIS